MSVQELEAILHPRSVAVVGASANTSSWGYSFTHHLLEYGFKGQIYPVNPGIRKYSASNATRALAPYRAQSTS